MKRNVENRSKVFLLGVAFTLGWITPGCTPTPTISTESKLAFERSFAAVKEPLSSVDRARLENAVFALAMTGAGFAAAGYGISVPQTYRWSVVWDGTDFNPNYDYDSRSGFVSGFRQAMQKISPAVAGLSFAVIIDAAVKLKLNIDDPFREGEARLVMEKDERRRELVEIGDKIVSLGVSCTQTEFLPRFSIHNETKWPIIGIQFSFSGGLASHDFSKAIAPGDWADLELVSPHIQNLPPCGNIRGTISQVTVIGRDPFAPVSRGEWDESRNLVDSMTKESDKILLSLRDLLDWVRSINTAPAK
jgi:hypothetical protein